MCLGFIVPGVILGYGCAAIALFSGASFLTALGVLVASGLGVTLTGPVWHDLVVGVLKAERPRRPSLPWKRTSGAEGQVSSQT